MPDDQAIDLAHTPFVDVQIRPTDRRGGDPHQHIGWCFESSILHRLNIQRPVTSPDYRFHRVSLLSSNLIEQELFGFPLLSIFHALGDLKSECCLRKQYLILYAMLPLEDTGGFPLLFHRHSNPEQDPRRRSENLL